MNGLALGIVLIAAFLHAGWNYLLKKSQIKIVFIWWFLLVALVFYFPMFLYYWPHNTTIPPLGWTCVAATGLLHAFYFWFMGGAYERGELSLVYPLSRGFSPLLVPFLAVLFIHEKISIPGGIGMALVILGIYIIHLKFFSIKFFFEPFLALRGGGAMYRWEYCSLFPCG